MLNQSPELAAPGSYLADLERSGLRVQQWRSDATALPLRPDRSTEALRYTSWSDGDLGIFVTDTLSPVAVDGEAITDFLAIGISYVAMGSEPGDINLPACHGILIQYHRKGSCVRVRTPRVALKAVTLCVSADALRDWVGPILPDTLQSALNGEEVLVRLPVQIEREGDHLFETPLNLPYAPLFYRTKSSMLFWLVLDYLRRWDEETCDDKVVSDRVRRRLELVRRSLDEAPQQRLSVEEMARRAGLNRTSLRALFKQVYGMKLSEYRTAELMQRAEKMLHKEHRSVTETAYALGYSGASSFTVAYKRHFGHPPGHLSMAKGDSHCADYRPDRHNGSAPDG